MSGPSGGGLRRGLVVVVLVGLGGALAAPHLTSWKQAQVLRRHDQQLEEAGEQLQEHHSELKRHDQVLAEHQRELEEHQGVLDAHGRELERHDQRLTAAEQGLTAARAARAQDDQQIKALQAQVTELRQEIERLQAGHAQTLRQQAVLKDVLRRLEVLEDNAGRPPID